MMTDEKRMFTTSSILSVTTGIFMPGKGEDFGAVHQLIEFIAGHDVWTHQLPEMSEPCRAHLINLHPRLADIEADSDNYRRVLAKALEDIGPQMAVTPLPKAVQSKANPFRGLEKFKGKTMIFVVDES